MAARHGFPTLQIPPDIYHDCIAAGTDAKALRRRLADAGVAVRVIDGITRGLPGMPTEPVLFKGRAMRRFDIAACLEVAEALAAPVVNVSHYGAAPAPLAATAEAVGAICRRAALSGVTIALEFVPDSGNPSIGNAQAIVAACGEANCNIHLDTWHLTPNGADLSALNFNLRAELHNAIGWQLEKSHGAFCIAHHQREELLAPDGHAGPARRDERLTSEEEAGLHYLQGRMPYRAGVQCLGNVDFVHEAVAEDDLMDPVLGRSLF